jgi:hypothetical protein
MRIVGVSDRSVRELATRFHPEAAVEISKQFERQKVRSG